LKCLLESGREVFLLPAHVSAAFLVRDSVTRKSRK
jgi:hypothetical protein